MIDAPTVGIGRLLKEGGRFLIPHHQRDYSWTEDELDQLFKDVYDAKNSGHDEYFVGLMVFKPESERIYTILDGQQRLATTVIILAAIRSWLTARGFEDDFRKIQSDYIAARELGEEEMEPSLVLNQANNDVFVRHVVHESPVEDIKRELAALNRYDPNRALLEAILFCRIRVDEIVAEVDSPTQGARRLFELVRYLRDSVKVVRLNVPNEVNAYTVFETLNDRGLDLSVLDLAKNHLFGQAGDETHLRDIQGGWSQMMANLTNVKADDFLKAWWTSRNGRVQSPQLFARFKERVSSRSAAGEVSRDMLTASEQYAALEVADDPLWSGYSEAAKERVRNLKLLGGQQVHPVLLSALERFPQGEVERLLRLLEILIVRYQLVGGGRTGRLEISCARLAHRIFERRCVDTTEAASLLKDILPNDDQFREHFRTKEEKNSRKARYLLASVERQARVAAKSGVAAAELRPSGTLTLEHVFPKSPRDKWEKIQEDDPDFAEDCTYRLGNLCLLTGVNRALGNESFEHKKSVFTESDLLITREIAEIEEWSRLAVESRQSAMAKLAVALWRVDY